jgi:hypothetical protein
MKTKRKAIHISDALYQRFLRYKAPGQSNPQTLENMIDLFERSHLDPEIVGDALIVHLDHTNKESYFVDSPYKKLAKLKLTQKELFDKATKSTNKPTEWWLIPALIAGAKERITHKLKKDLGVLPKNSKGASDQKIAQAWKALEKSGKPFNRQSIRKITGSGAVPINRWINTHKPQFKHLSIFNTLD